MVEQVTDRQFLTSEWLIGHQADGADPTSRGNLVIASCQSGDQLAARLVEHYKTQLRDAGRPDQVPHLLNVDFHFSDTETNVRLDRDVSGADVFLCQALLDPTSPRSIDENYMAFLIAARALREYGANHITGILPYLAYGRQDKPTRGRREPITAQLMADLTIEAGVDQMLTWDPHRGPVRGFYKNIPLTILDSLPFFAKVFERFAGRDDVIAVAPDAGAAKYMTLLGRELDLSCAITSKYRPQPEQAEVSDILGDFTGKRIAVIVDDMISSGGTFYALIRALVEKKRIEEVYVGVSHNLCLDSAYERLIDLHAHYGLNQLVVTNSVPQMTKFGALDFLSIQDLSDVFAWAINRIHYSRSVETLPESNVTDVTGS